MSDDQQTQTQSTDQTTSTQTADTTQQHNWEQRYKDTQSALQNKTQELQQAQQQLSALKQGQQKQPEVNNVSWDYSDPTKFFDPEKGFTEDFSKFVEDKIPNEILTEFGDTIRQARQIIAEQRAAKWDSVSGVDNTQKHVLDYLQQTYQGKELQDRVNDLEHPRYWETALKNTLTEMGDKNWKGDTGSEPNPLPDATSTTTLGVAPLDPNSNECSELMSDEKYRTDANFRANVQKRIGVWSKANK